MQPEHIIGAVALAIVVVWSITGMLNCSKNTVLLENIQTKPPATRYKTVFRFLLVSGPVIFVLFIFYLLVLLAINADTDTMV